VKEQIMNRREAIHYLGAAALGTAVPATAVADHGNAPGGGTPVDKFHAYLCAYHIAKKDPKFVVEAHHYCCAVNDDVHQCVIFDTNGKNARILGVEYIITDEVFQKLPDEEKKYYHPHRYEVIGGLLIAPGMPADAEKAFMAKLATTWGKTWHTWPDPKTALPMGEPLLMWSATRDGQIDTATMATRDRDFSVDTSDIRKRRSYLGNVPDVAPPRSIDEIGRQQ
jgi:Protein of unknown function (DUF1264)